MVAFELSASVSIGAIKRPFWENGHHSQSKNRTSLVKNKEVGQKDVVVNQRRFSPKICVHWIKVVGQETPNIRYGPLEEHEESL